MKVITIDGPVASGKSTVSKAIAQRIGFQHLSSGMLYRALAFLLVREADYSKKNLDSVSNKDIYHFLDSKCFNYIFEDDGTFHVLWKGKDLFPLLKFEDVDQYASIISKNELVRELFLKIQREIGARYDLVVDGRDSGSVVFPNALLKFYLTASLPVRAERWAYVQRKLGNNVTLEVAVKEIKERDERDKNRKIAPLMIPEGAIVIDNSCKTIQETVSEMEKYFKALI